MNPAKECPSRKKGMCKVADICYAQKAERQYPAVLPYRMRQAEAWNTSKAEDIIGSVVEAAEHCREPKIKYLRVNESGDFRNQWDVNRLSKVADALKCYNIRLYCYTAREDLNFTKVSDNMVVCGSSFMADNEFTAVPKDYELQSGELICPGNCRECHACKNKNSVKVVCKYH